MCMRMCALSFDEAAGALDARAKTGRATVAERPEPFDPEHDAYPGMQVPAYVPAEDSAGDKLVVVMLTWGFPRESKPGLIFNTRLETALRQYEDGQGMWAEAIAHGRCLVPVRTFYENHATERVASERTGKPMKRPYRFRLGHARAFLLAGIQQDGRLSIVTTEPNADVAPVHNRMPLVLGPGESRVWLGPDFALLADRSGLRLDKEPER